MTTNNTPIQDVLDWIDTLNHEVAQRLIWDITDTQCNTFGTKITIYCRDPINDFKNVFEFELGINCGLSKELICDTSKAIFIIHDMIKNKIESKKPKVKVLSASRFKFVEIE